MWWAKRLADGATVWPSEFVDDAGVPDMAAARRACRQDELACPDCGGAITATSASTRTRISTATGLPVSTTARAHFKHLAGAAADADCPGAARMSDEHLAAQENIARVLRRCHPGATVHLEAVHATPGHEGRSDIVLKPRVGTALSVELQASNMAVAELQDRTVDRAADGSVVEWVFIVDRPMWTTLFLFVPKAMVAIVLKTRGYVYLLENPMADEPRLWVAVHPWISSQIRDLRNRDGPDGHVHFLRVPRRVSDFTLVGTTPGAAGLRCEGLHRSLERWMRDAQRALDRVKPRAVARRAPAVELWQAEHECLERELAQAEQARAAARSVLAQANADATATAAAAVAEAAQPPAGVPKPRMRRRDRLWRWLRRQPQPDAFWSMVGSGDDRAERLAVSARARLRAVRDELASCDVEYQSVNERLAEHDARRVAAEQLDDARHGAAVQAARAELEADQAEQRRRIDQWLGLLP